MIVATPEGEDEVFPVPGPDLQVEAVCNSDSTYTFTQEYPVPDTSEGTFDGYVVTCI